jgi:hypothetical protein
VPGTCGLAPWSRNSPTLGWAGLRNDA